MALNQQQLNDLKKEATVAIREVIERFMRDTGFEIESIVHKSENPPDVSRDKWKSGKIHIHLVPAP